MDSMYEILTSEHRNKHTDHYSRVVLLFPQAGGWGGGGGGVEKQNGKM